MWPRRLTWLAGLVVAAGAAVLTAHGLIEVALGSRVPPEFGWLYPVITDGLALVAYAATIQLSGRGRGYAWSVVMLAAGLSGIAQAAYLAGGVDHAVPVLRFGVGAWPAVAAAIAAHLLYLIGKRQHPAPAAETSDRPAAETPGAAAGIDGDAAFPAAVHRALGSSVQQAGVQPSNPADVQPASARSNGGGSNRTTPVASTTGTRPGGGAVSPIGSARLAAESYLRRTGRWPSARELSALASVSRGTAATALQQLREHVVHGQPGGTNESSTATTRTPR